MDAVDKIFQRLKKLSETIALLKEMQSITLDELRSSPQIQAKAERWLQVAIECVIDISELIISDQRLRTPKDGGEAIIILGEAGILDKTFALEFSKASGFRNILVHSYIDIDYSIVADTLHTKLGDFDRFAKDISAYLT